MRKLYTGIIVALAVSVFLISFFIGRATALRNSEQEGSEDIYTGTVPIPKAEEESVNTSNKTEKVPAEPEKTYVVPDNDVNIPERMIFPCGENVQKEYSQSAVYSETMGDWRSHTGIDYAAEIGADVLCVCDGIVTNVYRDKLWGFSVEVSHGNKLKSVYKNLGEDIPVKKGDRLSCGQVVGSVGKSADIESMESPHLHFEMWQDGATLNPISYIY